MGVALVQLLLSMNVPQNHGPILVRYRLAVGTKNVLCGCSKQPERPFEQSGHIVRNGINYAGMQVLHLGVSKLRKVTLDFNGFLCFGSPTV